MANRKLTEAEKKERDRKKKEQQKLPIEEREIDYIYFDDIKEYVYNNGTLEDLEEFERIAFDDKGRYKNAASQKWFAQKFFPEKVKGLGRQEEIRALINRKKKELAQNN